MGPITFLVIFLASLALIASVDVAEPVPTRVTELQGTSGYSASFV